MAIGIISQMGSLLKKVYRHYGQDLLALLSSRGFTDLRLSFLEILSFICENEGPSIKSVGHACGLKKQTMTSHLNDLEKRGYIIRKVGTIDKREQQIYLTEYGERFRYALIEALNEIDRDYISKIGEVEIERLRLSLENFYQKMSCRPQGTKRQVLEQVSP